MTSTLDRDLLLHSFLSLQPRFRARFRSTMSPEMGARFSATVEELTPSQFEVLTLLQEHPDGLTMGELAAAHSSTAGTATPLVERLVRMGMVDRVRDGDDRRVVRVRLSPAARQRCEDLTHLRMQHLQGVTADLSDDELETLVRLMAKIVIPASEEAVDDFRVRRDGAAVRDDSDSLDAFEPEEA